MTQYIDKAALVAEIKNRIKETESMQPKFDQFWAGQISAFNGILKILDTFEVKDPYEQCVQYDSIKAGIQAHAETYSFNIESELFNQLTKEQQKLWRKEIEQAVISGGDAGVMLAKDTRYKENLDVKEVDLTDIKTKWLPTEKQLESLKDMLKYNIGVFDYQKFMDVNILYGELTKILDYETDRQK